MVGQFYTRVPPQRQRQQQQSPSPRHADPLAQSLRGGGLGVFEKTIGTSWLDGAAFAKLAVICSFAAFVLLLVAAWFRWSGGGFAKQETGLPLTAAAHGNFECKPAVPQEVATWTDVQRSWCCVKFQVGCPYKVCHNTNLFSYQTEAQQRFCCEMEGVGCPSSTTIRPLPFDCMLGPGGSTAGWADDKKAFCCHYSLRGCPTRTSTTLTSTTATETITTTTAQPTIMVPFPACSPEDRSCTTVYPTPLPLAPTTTVLAAYAAAAAAQPAIAAAYGTAPAYGYDAGVPAVAQEAAAWPAASPTYGAPGGQEAAVADGAAAGFGGEQPFGAAGKVPGASFYEPAGSTFLAPGTAGAAAYPPAPR